MCVLSNKKAECQRKLQNCGCQICVMMIKIPPFYLTCKEKGSNNTGDVYNIEKY